MIAYGAPAIRALLPAALILLAVAGTVTAADDTARRLLAQASAPVGKGTRSEIQNVQRLLKLLSSRYPEKYASADPKRVDGVFGDDTAIAIKNFQKTSGVSTPPRNNEALVSEILAALARMSSLKPKQPQVATPKAQQPAKPKADAAPVPKVTTPPVPIVVAPPVPRPETRTTPPIATKPAEGPVPKVVAKPVAQPAAKPPVPKAAPPTSTSKPAKSPPKPVVAQKAKPKKPTAAPKKAARAKPANDRLLYFVQVASLRDSQAAKREWRRIRDSNRAALGAENVYYEKANIKGRGVFYRILVGPVRDRETAAVLCSLLKRNGQTCVTTRRNLSAIKDPNAVIPSDPTKPDQQSRLADDKELAEAAGVSRPKKSKPSDSASSKKPAKETPATDSPLVSQADQPSQPSPPSTAAATISSEQSKADADVAKPGLPAATPDETKSESTGQENKDEDRKIAVAPLPATPPAPAAVADLPSDAGTMAKSPADTPKPSPVAGGSEKSAAAVPKPTETASIPAPPAMPKQSDARPAADSATPTPPAAATVNKTAGETRSTDETTSSAGTQDVAIARPAAPPSEPNTAQPTDTKAKTPLINVNIQLDSWDKIAVPAGLALLLIAGVVVYRKRRRKQKSAFAQIFGTDDLSLDLGAHAAGTSKTLDALEENFKSDPLRRARRIRDGFLHDVLDGELGEVTPDYSVESAMRINSELKHLLSAKPDDYKSIFLNWMFLSEVGTALHQKDILIDQLDSDISRELTLLQNYFKIHLLELDDRHSLRENLPGIFYCLQLPPLRQRETAAISVA
jgi:cell division septation protein DedD